MNQTCETGDRHVEADGFGTWFRLGTPWRVLLCELFRRLFHRQKIIETTDLPAVLQQTVTDVVRRTRLWKRERRAVARELSDHFADGLAAGKSDAQLIAEFGDPTTAAKLIRRAKIRCRGWAWHVWHLGWQVTLALSLLLVVVVSGMIIRYRSARATVTFDLITQFDDRNRAIPEADRAWPLYRAGLASIDVLSAASRDPGSYDLLTAMAEGPSHPDWDKSRVLLSKLDEPIALFLQATKHDKLGFVNRDPGNEQWTRWSFGSDWESYNQPGTMGPNTLLAQTSDMRVTIANILEGAMHAAIEDGDGPQTVKLALALLQLADHMRQTHHGYAADQVTFASFRTTLRRITSIVLDHPKLMTESDLRQLSDRVGTTLGGGRIAFRMDRELGMWEDCLQRLYSDDGNGNGRITQAGINELIDRYSYDLDRDLVDSIQTGDNATWSEQLWAMIAGTTIANQVADRRTMLEKMTELDVLRRQMIADIDTPPADSEYAKELNRIIDADQIYFLPIASYCKNTLNWETESNSSRLQVAVNIERDATLLMIELERFRRRTPSWPTSLDQLVSDTFQSIPVDLFSRGESAPLIYRVIDGQPRLYSVGPNHTDDQGEPPSSDLPAWKADTGDWQLIPPVD